MKPSHSFQIIPSTMPTRKSLSRASVSRPFALALLTLFLSSISPTLFSKTSPISLSSSLRTLPEETFSHTCPSLRSPLHRPPLFIFLHLHKTAGNTLKRSLFSFSKRNHLSYYHTCTQNPTPICSLQPLASLSYSQRQQLSIDIISGHQYFGVHTLFPKRDTRYFTFIRHPLHRKIAHFHQFESDQSLHHLYDYLVTTNRNYMTKRLSPASYTGPISASLRETFIDSDNFAKRAALSAAQSNLVGHFFFIGLQERFAESVCILVNILDRSCGRNGRLAKQWSLDVDKVQRMSDNRRGLTDHIAQTLPKDIRKATLEAEATDLQLYRFAVTLFEKKLRMYPQCEGIGNNNGMNSTTFQEGIHVGTDSR